MLSSESKSSNYSHNNSLNVMNTSELCPNIPSFKPCVSVQNYEDTIKLSTYKCFVWNYVDLIFHSSIFLTFPSIYTFEHKEV